MACRGYVRLCGYCPGKYGNCLCNWWTHNVV